MWKIFIDLWLDRLLRSEAFRDPDDAVGHILLLSAQAVAQSYNVIVAGETMVLHGNHVPWSQR
jgi:hypothetical protein